MNDEDPVFPVESRPDGRSSALECPHQDFERLDEGTLDDSVRRQTIVLGTFPDELVA